MIVPMKPPYEITTKILKLVSSISKKIGEANANLISKPFPHLRKQNKIKTIHSSLRIEGNTLTKEQITDLIYDKRVIGDNITPNVPVISLINVPGVSLTNGPH